LISDHVQENIIRLFAKTPEKSIVAKEALVNLAKEKYGKRLVTKESDLIEHQRRSASQQT